jgi:hypothetical protein
MYYDLRTHMINLSTAILNQIFHRIPSLPFAEKEKLLNSFLETQLFVGMNYETKLITQVAFLIIFLYLVILN